MMFCHHFQERESSEKGTVLVMFAVFMFALVPLLALSVDTYFMVQGRLEEQNLAEYATLTALDGYIVGSETGSTPQEMREAGIARSLVHLKSIEGENSVTGMKEGSGWNFSKDSCSTTSCVGSGWSLEYGYLDLDYGTFTPSPDPGLVNAIRFSIELPNNSFMSFFTNQAERQSEGQVPSVNSINNIKLPVSAIGYVAVDGSGAKYFRLYRNKATGVDGESDDDPNIHIDPNHI